MASTATCSWSRLMAELRAISRQARTMFRPSRSADRISIPSRPMAKRSLTPATSTRCRRPARTATSSSCQLLAERRRRSRRITGSDSTPLYSPDGKYIAYRAQLRGGYESDRFRLMLYERATGKITDVAPNFDRWVDSMAWSPDSKTIYFTAGNEGEAPIYALDVNRASRIRGRQELVEAASTTAHADARRQDAGLRPHVGRGAERDLHRAAAVHCSAAWLCAERVHVPDCLLSKASR